MHFSVPENKKIPELELSILEFWKKNKIFEKSVNERPEDNLYVFYDGPPFISGMPHYGHLLSSVAKDLIPRYWTMKGKRVERVWGWDAHGITVENAVQKELGIKNRREIETFGLEKFIEACEEYTTRISTEWEWYIDRIARWVDIKNAYKTKDQTYMESVLWAFKTLYDKGLIYEGVRTSLYCPTCGTPVSNFEISMDNSYKEVEDPAVSIKFKITSEGVFKDAFIIAWTTTPWTLPSNRALVINPKSTYVMFEFEGENLIVAKDRYDFVCKDKTSKIVKEFLGKDLEGLSYAPLYEMYESNENDFKVYSFENMVNMEDGTGIVHSAPGFGDIDTQMGQHYGLSMTMAIDDTGSFKPGNPGVENPYEGMFYKKANRFIREDLTNRGLMFEDTVITHRFPFHDRCNTLLIHRAQKSWFVDVNALKPKMLEENEDINWVPENIKEGQFVSIIENAPDWGISRSRFWATPMPVWQAEDGDKIVVGSIKELEELSGQKVEDLHRPYIDDVTIEKDGKTYTRIPEVLDSWFEAGSMPFAQIHYPFENQEKFESNFPGDYIIEYIAQVRAWFNVMHRLSVALFDKKSFKNVISTGVMFGNDGRKMSKSYGNYADPKDVLENIGGDALRLFLMNSPLMSGGNANFDETELKTKSRNVLNPLWNSLKFFLIYATQHEWQPDFTGMPKTENSLDLWIITRLHQTIREFATNTEAYHVAPAVQALEDFVDDLSRWYVRRSRDRISSGNKEALDTFYYVLLEFSKAAAPAIPFIAETVFKNLTDEESVHLAVYPEFDDVLINENKHLIENMYSDREVVRLVLAERVSNNLPIRQPLQDFKTTKEVYFEDVVKDELNVKEIILVDSLQDEKIIELNLEITEELANEKLAREVVRKLQSLRKAAGLSVEDAISATYPKEIARAVAQHESQIMDTVGAVSLELGDEYTINKEI